MAKESRPEKTESGPDAAADGARSRAKRAGRWLSREVLVPVIAALVVIQFVIQAFRIPSSSMEDSLLVGDFLLGIKFAYGAPIPFSDGKLPGVADPDTGDVIIFQHTRDPD